MHNFESIKQAKDNVIYIDYREGDRKEYWINYLQSNSTKAANGGYKLKLSGSKYLFYENYEVVNLYSSDICFKSPQCFIGVEYKTYTDLIISQDSRHLHEEIDKMNSVFDRCVVVAPTKDKLNFGHNNYFAEWIFNNVHYMPCNNLEEATKSIFNIFFYSQRKKSAPQNLPKVTHDLYWTMLQGVIGLDNKQRQSLYATLSPQQCFKADKELFKKVKGIGDETAVLLENQFKRYNT